MRPALYVLSLCFDPQRDLGHFYRRGLFILYNDRIRLRIERVSSRHFDLTDLIAARRQPFRLAVSLFIRDDLGCKIPAQIYSVFRTFQR